MRSELVDTRIADAWTHEAQEWVQSLPSHMREPAVDYVLRGRPIGGFLTALFSNDLVWAVSSADAENQASIQLWAAFLVAVVPSNAWGSAEKVKAWQERGGLTEKKPLRCEVAAG